MLLEHDSQNKSFKWNVLKINKLYEKHRGLKILTSAQVSSLRVNNASDIFYRFLSNAEFNSSATIPKLIVYDIIVPKAPTCFLLFKSPLSFWGGSRRTQKNSVFENEF
jgi:hypothetical protein